MPFTGNFVIKRRPDNTTTLEKNNFSFEKIYQQQTTKHI